MLAAVARSLRVIHDLGEPLPTTFDSFRIVETYAETAAGAGRQVPEAYERGARPRARDRGGADRPRARPGALPQRPPGRQLHPRGAEQLWIVDWEYAGMGDRYFDLANFAVNNELGEAGEEAAAGAPTSAERGRRARAGGRAAADEVHVGLPRGDVGRGPDARVSELDFDFEGYADKHFDRLLETAAHRTSRPGSRRPREPAG